MVKKVGIIGFGNIAERNHAKKYTRIPDMFQFTDVYDLSEARMKRAQDLYGVTVHATMEDFLK